MLPASHPLKGWSPTSDEGLELLRMRKLLELQRKQLLAEARREKQEEEPRSILVKSLAGRGLEVLEAAEAQYPKLAEIVVQQLAALLKNGKIQGPISGEELYDLFLRLGAPVKLQTRIYYEKKGKRKSLADVLKEKAER